MYARENGEEVKDFGVDTEGRKDGWREKERVCVCL